MKQKIVMKVQMNGQDGRQKALEIATKIGAVESIAIEGKEEDQLVVIGTGVDVIKLLQTLRRKRKLGGHAEIISITEVKEEKEAKEGEAKETKALSASEAIWVQYPPYPIYSVYDPFPSICSIL